MRKYVKNDISNYIIKSGANRGYVMLCHVDHDCDEHSSLFLPEEALSLLNDPNCNFYLGVEETRRPKKEAMLKAGKGMLLSRYLKSCN